MPVSATEKQRRQEASPKRSQRRERVIEPWVVNLMAFPKRLMRICLRRISSPWSSSGISPKNSVFSFTCVPCSRASINAVTSFSRAESRKESSTRRILPDSILEKSRMSLIRASSVRDADFIFAAWRLAVSSALSRRMNSAMPVMEFMGVRISWLILARKLLFALSAASARSMASTTSVMSAKMMFSPATLPSFVVMQVMVICQSIFCPSTTVRRRYGSTSAMVRAVSHFSSSSSSSDSDRMPDSARRRETPRRSSSEENFLPKRKKASEVMTVRSRSSVRIRI